MWQDKLVTAASLFIAFITYDFMGWAYESTIWAVGEKKRFINRGYLLGPYCPIYGFVSLMDWYLLNDIKSPVKIFITAMFVCCVLEYVTSLVLEKLFHKRWWDYSNYPLNFEGRISVFSAVLFGVAGLALVKIVHPWVMWWVAMIPVTPRLIIAVSLAAVFVGDIILTTVSLNHANRQVEKIYDAISYRTNAPFDMLNERTKNVRAEYTHRVRGTYLKLAKLGREADWTHYLYRFHDDDDAVE